MRKRKVSCTFKRKITLEIHERILHHTATSFRSAGILPALKIAAGTAALPLRTATIFCKHW